MPRTRSGPPNIVLICTDQLRFDALGTTGSPVARTPHLDALAARGLSFDNHITPCQICAPSRASLFTGLLPRHHGLAHNGLALDPSVELISHVLADAGVRAHGVGKLHFQPILASAAYGMPESNAFWTLPQSATWTGPYYGFQTVDFVIGESFAATRGGHYGQWLEREHPGVAKLYLPEHSLDESADEMDEVWRSAVPADLHYNSWIADRSIDFLRSRKGADTPFFLFTSFPDPHHPFSPPAPYCDLFDPRDMPMPTIAEGELERMPDYIRRQTWTENRSGCLSYKEFLTSASVGIEQGAWERTDGFPEQSVRKMIAYTHAMVKMIDDCVGRILAALEEDGLAQDTIVVFTSDHGELLGDHGLIRKGPMPYRQLLHIPLLLAGPGIPAGTRVSDLTSHLDVKATILDLMGVAGKATDGASLAPLIAGKPGPRRDATFTEYHPRTVANQYNQTILAKNHRLTIYPEATDQDWGELFDHSNDPGEHVNRYHDPACREIRDRLRARLAADFPPDTGHKGHVLGFY